MKFHFAITWRYPYKVFNLLPSIQISKDLQCGKPTWDLFIYWLVFEFGIYYDN